MLKIENVRKQYPGFELDCSLEVPDGTIVGLIGANGAGKSTMFKTILGLIRMDSGSIEIFGKPINNLQTRDKELIGVVLSESGPSGYMSIKNYLPVFSNLFSEFDREGFIKRCERFNLPMGKNIKEFSTGMKRKLQILVALSHNARLLILDEPTSGLDVVAREELLELLREYMEPGDRSILISSHISTDLEGFCDDIYMLDEGKIILHEDADRLIDEYALLKVTKDQFEKLDKNYLVTCKKESYGYQCLTNRKQFYQENYPDLVLEKGNIDTIIYMMIRGERL